MCSQYWYMPQGKWQDGLPSRTESWFWSLRSCLVNRVTGCVASATRTSALKFLSVGHRICHCVHCHRRIGYPIFARSSLFHQPPKVLMLSRGTTSSWEFDLLFNWENLLNNLCYWLIRFKFNRIALESLFRLWVLYCIAKKFSDPRRKES